MKRIARHAATPELNVHRIVASAASDRRIVLCAHNDEAAMIELACSSIFKELVAVRFEVDGVAVRSCSVRTQAAEDKRSEAIVVKPVTGRDDANHRVLCPVVDDGAAHLLSPGKIALHAYIDRAGLSSLKVSYADSFSKGDVVAKEIAIDDIGLDGLTRGLRPEVENIQASCRSGRGDVCHPDERGPGIECLQASVDICSGIDCVTYRQPRECVIAETHSDGCVRAGRHTIHGWWKRTQRKARRINDHCVSVAFNTNDRHIHLQLHSSCVGPLCALRIGGREHVSSRVEYE